MYNLDNANKTIEFIRTHKEVLTQLGYESDELDSLGAKAFMAAQEAKTFTEAINSVKDAVSTGWMNSFELIFGDYQEAKKLWTDLANDLWDIFLYILFLFLYLSFFVAFLNLFPFFYSI